MSRLTSIKKHLSLKKAASEQAYILLYEYRNGLDSSQKRTIQKIHNELLHQQKGLEKQLKKELEKMKKAFDIQALSQELLESLPWDGEAALYDDGSLAYLTQGGMTQAEFNGDVKRIGYVNLSRDYWHDTMLEYDCSFDTITDDLKEDLLEHFNNIINIKIERHLSDDY